MLMPKTQRFKAGAAMLAVMLIAFAAAGCKKTTVEITPEVASSDEALFKMGESFIKKDPEKGLIYLRQVIDSFPKSFYAQRAKLLIADSYFDKGDEGSMILAAAEYREFINLYPYSPSAAYCQFRIAMTFYAKALKPGRDQTRTRQALAEFRRVVANYPLSEYAAQAEEKIRDSEERLAEHTMTIARHYHRARAYRAATSRLTELLTAYPMYSKMDEVYFLLGDSFFLWGQMEQAQPFLTKLLTDFPESSYASRAESRLREIENRAKN
jgi:outer membrane protein assembly factor BamD